MVKTAPPPTSSASRCLTPGCAATTDHRRRHQTPGRGLHLRHREHGAVQPRTCSSSPARSTTWRRSPTGPEPLHRAGRLVAPGPEGRNRGGVDVRLITPDGVERCRPDQIEALLVGPGIVWIDVQYWDAETAGSFIPNDSACTSGRCTTARGATRCPRCTCIPTRPSWCCTPRSAASADTCTTSSLISSSGRTGCSPCTSRRTRWCRWTRPTWRPVPWPASWTAAGCVRAASVGREVGSAAAVQAILVHLVDPVHQLGAQHHPRQSTVRAASAVRPVPAAGESHSASRAIRPYTSRLVAAILPTASRPCRTPVAGDRSEHRAGVLDDAVGTAPVPPQRPPPHRARPGAGAAGGGLRAGRVADAGAGRSGRPARRPRPAFWPSTPPAPPPAGSSPRSSAAVDVDPGADGRVDYGLTCRLYATPDGHRGRPADAVVLAALRRLGDGYGRQKR